ncbi:hypothetical protein [Terriglobus albidus]|uniref:hypothetical protein n=1 Tax=Terriglobus albidus TaxID=1592106 RepID=UPI0021DF711C|nr:hypothetical protein [Terriglobus albidus]
MAVRRPLFGFEPLKGETLPVSPCDPLPASAAFPAVRQELSSKASYLPARGAEGLYPLQALRAEQTRLPTLL